MSPHLKNLTYDEAMALLDLRRFVRRAIWPAHCRLIGNAPFPPVFIDQHGHQGQYWRPEGGGEEVATDWEEYIAPPTMPPNVAPALPLVQETA